MCRVAGGGTLPVIYVHNSVMGMERGDRVLFEGIAEPAVKVRFEGDRPIVSGVNEAFETTFGLSESDVVGDSLDAHIVGPTEESETATLNRETMTGSSVEREVRRETSDGMRWFLLRTVPFVEDGTQQSYCIYIDITEPKRQRTRFESLIKQSTDIISVLDASGTYQYQSPSATDQLGYDPEEMVGETAFDYVHPDDREQVIDEFVQAVGDPDAVPTVTYRFQHADGSWRWLESRGNNQLRNEAVSGFVVNTRDVTERVESQRELQLLTQVFSRVFRHNVRNRLNVIEGHAELLREEYNGETTDSIEMIFETTERLLEHSRKAQLIATVVEERMTHELDLQECIDEVARATQMRRPDVRITLDVDAVSIRAHPEFPEAIRELIRNALRHAPADRDPRVDIWTEVGTSTVTLFVEDNAGGLREGEVQVLEEAEETELRHGSGVGLWLVKWLIERSHGELSIRQTAQGSRVGLTLHHGEADPDETARRNSAFIE